LILLVFSQFAGESMALPIALAMLVLGLAAFCPEAS
jgi:hypothetical protein